MKQETNSLLRRWSMGPMRQTVRLLEQWGRWRVGSIRLAYALKVLAIDRRGRAITMDRAHFLTLLVLVTAASGAGFASEQKRTHPNIVFILADDLGINDLCCYGRKDQATPNLDKLAKQGARFTSAYAAASVCSPTRAAILTGHSPAHLKLTTFLPGRGDAVSQLLLHPAINQQLPRNVRTLAEMLRAVGYRTGCIGKWHLGGKGALPTERGFDYYHAGQALTKPSATEGGKGEYDLTEKAEKFIEDNKAQPFFLYLCHNNPHVQLVAKQELIAKHQDAFNPIYAAMIETLDDCVGRIMAKLDALGLAEDTIVVFTSDNGGLHVLETPNTPATHHRRFRGGKGFLYEGGVRVPLLVAWPRYIRGGRVVDAPLISTDWTPTLLGLVNVTVKDQFEGENLREVVLGMQSAPKRALFWHQPHYTNQGGRPAGAIRIGDWKLIEHYENGACELYQLADDPGESADLAAKEPARVADLRGKLEAWRRSVGAQENTANPDFNGKVWRRLYADLDSSRLAVEDQAATMATKLEPWRALMNQVLSKPKKMASVIAPGAGAVILHARNGKVQGEKLRYENQPHKDTLGFWVNEKDFVEWTLDVPHAGKFDVEILQACGKGSGGSEVEIAVATQTLKMIVEETGHFQRFVPRTIGTLTLAAGPATLMVRAKSKPGGAVMDLRRIVLRSGE
jgi:arylsulfatase A-like enzyme